MGRDAAGLAVSPLEWLREPGRAAIAGILGAAAVLQVAASVIDPHGPPAPPARHAVVRDPCGQQVPVLMIPVKGGGEAAPAPSEWSACAPTNR